MQDEWQVGPLGNFVAFLSGGTPTKSHSDYWGGNVPWISAKDMKSFWIDDSEDHLTCAGLEQATHLVPEGTTLILTRGMTLHNDVPICRVRKPSAFNQDVKAAVSKGIVDEDFIPYLLLGNKSRLLSIVDSAGHGTGRLSSNPLLNLEVNIPPISEQRAIAHILSTLDDKIELNRRMNETLEAIAQAIFKSWFVDCDPVRAKASGEAPDFICHRLGLTRDLLALFPDSFQESELGEIPKGWKVERLGELLVLQRGFDLPTTTREAGQYPVYSASGFHGTHSEYMVKGPGVVTGRSGILGNVFLIHEDFWPLNTTLWVKEFKGVGPLFACQFLQRIDFSMFNAGSAVPTLNRNHIHSLLIIAPQSDIIFQYEGIATPILQQIRANTIQSETLSSLRDTLLPKLLSGELRVKEADALVAQVT